MNEAMNASACCDFLPAQSTNLPAGRAPGLSFCIQPSCRPSALVTHARFIVVPIKAVAEKMLSFEILMVVPPLRLPSPALKQSLFLKVVNSPVFASPP